MDDNTTLIIAVCFGALMVGIHSWSRFDEPSYNTQSEYFARYEPKFATYHTLYQRAKWAYVGAVVAIYIILSLAPGVFTTLSPSKSISGAEIPLAAALAIVTLQNFPGIKELEQQLRGFLHAIARIPDGVRRTVAQMRGSPFNVRPEMTSVQSRKISALFGSNIGAAASEDEVYQNWYRITGLLLALSEANRPQSGIDLLFFDHYKDEFDSISARHEALADRISKYETDQDHSTAREHEDSDLLRDVRDLRDRLYTFVACGVYSSATTDADRFEILRTLGFSVSHVSRAIDISPLIGASVMAMITLSVFTGYTVELFRDGFKLNALDPGWKRALPIPTMPFEIYAWSWSTAAFYLTTIFAALLVRNTRIARRQWFDLNNLERERPIPRYVTPTFVGAAVGILTLSGIAIVGGPGMKGSFGELAKAVANALPWSPLALFMALIALVISDNQLVFGGNVWRKIAGYAVLSAVLMGGVGYLNSHLIIWTGIDEYAARTGQPVPEIVSSAGTYLSPFIAFQIGLIVFVLCAIIQIYEYYAMKARSFSGKAVEIIAKQEAIFLCILTRPARRLCCPR